MLARQGRGVPLEEAIRMYERAIELDANYALAYAALASARNWLYTYWGGDLAQAREAQRAARKAVALAPNLAEAHAVLATCLSSEGGNEAAQRAFDEALRLNSNSPWVLQAYGDHLFRSGAMELAAEYYQKAVALDPERREVRGMPLALILKRLGRHDEFVEYVRKNFELSSREAAVDPGDARAVYLSGLSLLRLGETQKGLEWIERALAIDSEDALLLYNVACAFALAGETDRALAALEKTVANGLSNLSWLENDADFDSIRDHPRFGAIVRRLRKNSTS
jgi:adenylate cyclase